MKTPSRRMRLHFWGSVASLVVFAVKFLKHSYSRKHLNSGEHQTSSFEYIDKPGHSPQGRYGRNGPQRPMA